MEKHIRLQNRHRNSFTRKIVAFTVNEKASKSTDWVNIVSCFIGLDLFDGPQIVFRCSEGVFGYDSATVVAAWVFGVCDDNAVASY